jgi:eukaryotic-like serine/threonine-protein kinase
VRRSAAIESYGVWAAGLVASPAGAEMTEPVDRTTRAQAEQPATVPALPEPTQSRSHLARAVVALGLAILAVASVAIWIAAKKARQPPEDRMIRIPAGSFMMGSDNGAKDERPTHRVEVGSFEIDQTEVVVAAYEGCRRAGICTPSEASDQCNAGKPEKANHPINCVDLNQARAYCAWARKRLPTEEEWEYAARGTDGREYPWGKSAPADQLCWTPTSANRGTCPAGAFPSGASPFGVLDLSGNVWEWTASGYSKDYQSERATDRFVLRGGGWRTDDRLMVSVTERYGEFPENRALNIGFRCAR